MQAVIAFVIIKLLLVFFDIIKIPCLPIVLINTMPVFPISMNMIVIKITVFFLLKCICSLLSNSNSNK